MTLSKGLIRADIIAAKQAIEYYEANKTKDIKNIAAYHLQQAAEKLIKIQIYGKCYVVDYNKLYTHNLEKLIVYAESLGVSLIIPDHIKENSLVITAWEAGSRYDIGFSIRINQLKKTYEVVADWIKKIP